MTKSVISVYPEISLVEAAKVIVSHNFDGLPVIDHDNNLIGIITTYDLISKGSLLHLPTFQIILKNVDILKKDLSELKEDLNFKEDLKTVASLTVKDIMNSEPLTVSPDTTLEKAIMIFRDHHRVNPIPVINDHNKVVGVLSRFDVLKPFNFMDA